MILKMYLYEFSAQSKIPMQKFTAAKNLRNLQNVKTSKPVKFMQFFCSVDRMYFQKWMVSLFMKLNALPLFLTSNGRICQYAN